MRRGTSYYLTDAEAVDGLRNGRTRILGGQTVADLLAALNEAGLGPEEVEIAGTGDHNSMAVILHVNARKTELPNG